MNQGAASEARNASMSILSLLNLRKVKIVFVIEIQLTQQSIENELDEVTQ